jgi:predicted metal-dependent HD superfamily phosphohydrolase
MDELWLEIDDNYSSKNRHYHTLQHLDNLLVQLSEIKHQILNWDTVLFSMYYHDIIYNSLKSNNEEKSAALAEKRLKQISVASNQIESCKNQILATKTHINSTDMDINYFTDADLSILGQNWESYLHYSQNVRKEYAIYPDMIYNPGRKKVLMHFLEMGKIYKTDFFRNKFEEQAKSNIQREIDML